MYGLGTISGKDWGGAMSYRVPVRRDATPAPRPSPVSTRGGRQHERHLRRLAHCRAAAGSQPGGVGPGRRRAVPRASGSTPSPWQPRLGALKVEYRHTNSARLKLAARLGAVPVEGPPLRSRQGVTRSWSRRQRQPARRACSAPGTMEPGGLCTSVYTHTPETPVPLLEMYTYGVTVAHPPVSTPARRYRGFSSRGLGLDRGSHLRGGQLDRVPSRCW